VTLEERYANDLWLLGFYKDKLFDPGWPGELDAVGLEYIKSKLNKSSSLRRCWEFHPSAKRLSENHIEAEAMYVD